MSTASKELCLALTNWLNLSNLPGHSHEGHHYQGLEDHTTDTSCGEFLWTPYPPSIVTNFPHWLQPQVTKKQVDNFREGKVTPCCQLKAHLSGRRKKIPYLSHQVALQGAKYPHNVFTIDLPAEGMFAVKITELIVVHLPSFLSDPNPQSGTKRSQTFGDLASAGKIT